MEDRRRRSTPGNHVGAAAAARRRRSRFADDGGGGGGGGGEGSVGGDGIECSGERCRSCTAGVVADCAAVCCCCPCAVVNLLALALVRVPYMVWRRCLARRKKSAATAAAAKKKRKCGRAGGGSSERERIVEEGMRESVYGFGFEEGLGGGGGGGGGGVPEEAEERSAWLDLDLYEVGHLSFGRVSFTGVQFQGKGGCS
ncbi:uncharacterized protein LOC115688324 [Syzygium oleosum]|uniref:uncharacterized protein LOC115688324 n=1 Tax=Syzygium oleosum TaxID=219896 RepID=UPI0011D1D619|nr:uncharacterized protein LOC115688324 [Syzygium oleosum]